MLFSLFLSIVFLITDVIFMIAVSKRGGINPFWRVSFFVLPSSHSLTGFSSLWFSNVLLMSFSWMISRACLTGSQNQLCERSQHSNIEITHHHLLTNMPLLIFPRPTSNQKARDLDLLPERKWALFFIQWDLETTGITNLLQIIARLLWTRVLRDHGSKTTQDVLALIRQDGEGSPRIT